MTTDEAINKVLQELREMTPDELREALYLAEDSGFGAALIEAGEFLNDLFEEELHIKHSKCAVYSDEMNGDYGCHYNSVLSCEECKYGLGRKDPEAKCNQN